MRATLLGAVRRSIGLAGWAVLIGIAATWFALLRPVVLGGSVTYVIVRGDSMLPLYQAGDLVVLRAATDYVVGDVVAYRVPAGDVGAGQIVIHRLVAGDGTTFVARGDNTPAPDPWPAEREQIVGRAWLALPGAGRVLLTLATPMNAAALAAAIVVAFIIANGGGRTVQERGRQPA